MKKLALMLVFVAGGLLHAQEMRQANPDMAPAKQMNKKENLSPDEKAKRDADRAEKSLGLNADQKAKWEVAAKERINANTPLREKAKGSTTPEERKDLRRQMGANSKKFDETVVAFLTPDQKAKWDQEKQDRKHHHKDKMHKPRD